MMIWKNLKKNFLTSLMSENYFPLSGMEPNNQNPTNLMKPDYCSWQEPNNLTLKNVKVEIEYFSEVLMTGFRLVLKELRTVAGFRIDGWASFAD